MPKIHREEPKKIDWDNECIVICQQFELSIFKDKDGFQYYGFSSISNGIKYITLLTREDGREIQKSIKALRKEITPSKIVDREKEIDNELQFFSDLFKFK